MTLKTIVVLAVAGLAAAAPRSARADKDPQAVEVAENMMQAMGGKDSYQAQRMLTFTFTVVRGGKTLVSRTHRWDRWTGRYRLEATTKDGRDLVALFNVNDRKGRVWLSGNEVTGTESDQYLEQAYGEYINDSYWLLMPWKWLDDGVNLAYDGTKTVNGNDYDVVELTFGNGVGLTSNDHYWGFVSKTSHLMERWEFILQDKEGNRGSGPPSAFAWEDWKGVGGGIKLSERKVQQGENADASIVFPVVTLSSTVDETAFTPPTP